MKASVIFLVTLTTVALYQTRYVVAQQNQPQQHQNAGGLQGLIAGIVNSASDTITNAFDTSNLCINFMATLLNDAHHTLSNNPFTQGPFNHEDPGVTASLTQLRTIFVDSYGPTIDTIHMHIDRVGDMKSEFGRVRSIVDRAQRDIKLKGTRCLTPFLATQITTQIYQCTLLPVKNIIADMRNTQMEIGKIYNLLDWQVHRRRECIKARPAHAIPCLQILKNETPGFFDGLSRIFEIHATVQEYMMPINDCLKILRDQTNNLCPGMYK